MAVGRDRETPGLMGDLLKEMVMTTILDLDLMMDTGLNEIAAVRGVA